MLINGIMPMINGILPSTARPEATPTTHCSAMPVSMKRSGCAFLKSLQPQPMSGVRSQILSSFFASSVIASPTTVLPEL